MNGIFRIDGPLYRFGNMLYYLLVSNILWFVFSLPLFTIGASTTALYFVMGKIVRDEDPSILKDFWKSFKMNFKQSTVIWLILLIPYLIVYINIKNISLLGNMAKYILPVQIAVLFELIIITIYIFPVLSRYDLKTRNLIKTCFFLGNRHILSTILCVGSLTAVAFLLYKFTGLFILFPVSLYALVSYYIIHRLFKKYMPDEKKEESDKKI